VFKEPAACSDCIHSAANRDHHEARRGALHAAQRLVAERIASSYVEALQPPAACTFGKPHVERKPPATGHLGLLSRHSE
jgi:hypothetical protein